MPSLITLHHINQLHRLLIRFSWTENILLINAAGRLCVSDCVCVCVRVSQSLSVAASECAELRSVNLISVCVCVHVLRGCPYASVQLRNVNVISVCVSVCVCASMYMCVCVCLSLTLC